MRPLRVSNRKPNPTGDVPVLMYHKFESRDSRYSRSYEHFREDLQRLYDLGFRPILVSEYLANIFSLLPGASPVVITLDDSHPSQFRLLKDGTVDPDCAFGIWQAFASEHPDFPVRATWYVVPTEMWGQKRLLAEKLRMITETGSELACHTWNHPVLRKLSDQQVRDQIAKSLDFLAGLGFPKVSFAYPYGVFPRNMAILDGFYQNGRAYTLTGAVTCETKMAPAPGTEDVRPFKIPRIEAVNGSSGLDAWLDKIEAGKIQVYVAP